MTYPRTDENTSSAEARRKRQLYQWWTHPSGYKLQEHAEYGTTLVLAADESPVPVELPTDLYLRFITIRTSEDVLAFANRWGILGRRLAWRGWQPDYFEIIGADWLQVVETLWSSVQAARCLQGGGPDGYFSPSPEDPRAMLVRSTDGSTRSIGRDVPRAHLCDLGDLVPNSQKALALLWLTHGLNCGLEDGVGPQISFRGGWRRTYVHKTLEGALWQQLLDSLLENRAYGECEHCGRLFDVPPRARPRIGNTSKTYCGDNCRQAARRKRKREEIEHGR